MADQNQELAEVMERVNREMALYGQLTKETADAYNDAKVGIKGFSQATRMAGGAVESVGKAATAAAGAMYEGKKGASAFNDSITELGNAAKIASAALALLVPGGPIIKLFVAGLGAAVAATGEYVKAANDMADKLYKGYSGMAKAGAAASDGLTGMYKDAKKLGLSMNELDQFVGLVSENSKDLALFAGTAFEGRKKFAEMGNSMEKYRTGLIAAGYTQEQINEGTMGYLRLQTRLGASQKMTTDQLAAGAKRYLDEQDALAKVTGQSRKEMEDQQARALQQQQFASKIRELQMQGRNDEARELIKLNSIYAAAGPKMASAFQASVTGNLANADSIEANIASNGELLKTADLVSKGQMSAAEAAQKTGKTIGKFNDSVNVTLAGVNAGIGDFTEQERLRQLADGDIVENMKKAEEERKKQGMDGAKAADGITDQYAKNIKKQQELNKAMEDAVFKGISNAQSVTSGLATATGTLTTAFDKLTTGVNKLLRIVGLGENENKVETKQTEISDAEKKLAAAIESQKSAKTTEEKAAADREEKFYKEKTELLKEEKAALEKEDKNAKLISEVFKRADDEVKIKKAALDKSMATASWKQEYLGVGLDKDQKKAKEEYWAAVQKERDLRANTGGAMDKAKAEVAASAPAMATSPKSASGKALKTGAGDLEGLTIKEGDVQQQGASVNPKIIELAKQVQANLPGFDYFSGFNDKFHNEKSPGSEHTKGLAMDFVLKNAPSKDDGQEIAKWLKNLGASYVQDEYNNPSSKATAGHIHAEIPAYADGGIAKTPQIAFVGEKGPEAMIPLDNGAIPIKMTMVSDTFKALTEMPKYEDEPTTEASKPSNEIVNEFKSVIQEIKTMPMASVNDPEIASLLNELLREQRTANDSLQKIYQVSAN